MASVIQSPSDHQLEISGREELGDSLHVSVVGAATAAVLARKLVLRDCVLRGIKVSVGTTGSGGTTTVRVLKNGVAVSGASVSIDNADSDGTVSQAGPSSVTTLVAGDLLEIEASAVATGNADVTAVAVVAERKDV